MDRVSGFEFLLSNLKQKGSRAPYCYDKCFKKVEEFGKELSREQEICLGTHLFYMRQLQTEIRSGHQATGNLIT
jgi:hypothetical protein